MADRQTEDERRNAEESVIEARNHLATIWATVRAQLGPQPSASLPPQSIEEIDRVLTAKYTDWAELNRAELLILNGMDGEVLDEEIDRRLAEAATRKLRWAAAAQARYKTLNAEKPATPARKRAFLYGVVTDLQHFVLKSVQVRRLRKSAVRYVAFRALIAVAFALVPFLAFLLHQSVPGWTITEFVDNLILSFPNYGLYTAIAFGWLGALFSRFIAFQKTYVDVPLDDAEAYYSPGNIRLHMLIGMAGAMIMYFVASSGLVAGSLVPDITQLTYVQATAVVKPPPHPQDARRATAAASAEGSGAASEATGTTAEPSAAAGAASGQPDTPAVKPAPTAPNGEAPSPPKTGAPVTAPDTPATPPVQAPVDEESKAPAGAGDRTPTINEPGSDEGVITVINEWTNRALVPSKNLALLIVWALVAGFSERLVPNMLTSTAKQIESSANAATPPSAPQ